MQPRFLVLGDVVVEQSRTRGDKVALRGDDESVTYAQLRSRACQAANGLLAAGVMPGDRVAYLAKNSVAYYELLFGAVAAGAVLVPINWRLALPEIEWILRNSGAVVLFVGADLGLDAQALSAGLPNLRSVISLSTDYAAWRDCQAPDAPSVSVEPDDVAVQLYTSGTTGKPKGAMISHRALLVFRSLRPEDQPEWNRWTDDDVSLIVMPQFHIGGTGFGLQTLCAGATGLVMTEFDAGRILDFIEHEGLSKIFTVPSAMQLLLRHPRVRKVDYRRIRTMVYGASPIPLELLREAMQVFGCGFVQQYGMTEATGTICALPPEDHDSAGNQRMRSAGKPLPGVEIRVLGPDGADMPQGMTGEIAVRSPTLMRGYWNLPEATAAAMTADGCFLTGDAGSLDADGYLYIQDRVKDMIVSGGENVYPAEVETVLWEHPAIHEVAVIGVPDEKWGEAVKAVVVPVKGEQPDPAAIIAWARGRLAGFKLPKSIDFVDALPRNAGGKVLRRELREPYWAGRERKVN